MDDIVIVDIFHRKTFFIDTDKGHPLLGRVDVRITSVALSSMENNRVFFKHLVLYHLHRNHRTKRQRIRFGLMQAHRLAHRRAVTQAVRQAFFYEIMNGLGTVHRYRVIVHRKRHRGINLAGIINAVALNFE